ncbi:aminodeoxychorismate synthase, component I [Fredinandcohnia quinoae]|uniref:Aminodeoxychorismate synthase component 1 n=1 Tax=Fredinandcohnia quinoae TaxID=2918902 RepID=A0AAW5E6P9_9BACI|nr:aminodeoxychorismate synthase, component I [Fredinandcohnia sp. SECRCQ15]MCH1626915.1 aminodeoxychorismate synthase, component I [Fredinandcohnia sp. SECRCQ15]
MQRKRISFAKKIDCNQEKWFLRYKHLSKNEPHHILLESGRGGTYSIIGLRPFAILEGKNSKLSIKMGNESKTYDGDPLELMMDWMKVYGSEPNPDQPDFQGGAIGYISYDYARYIEKLSSEAEDDLQTPDLYFLVFDDVFIYEHQEQSLWIITNDFIENELQATNRLHMYEEMWSEPTKETNYSLIKSVDTDYQDVSLSEADFIKAVDKVREYIAQGDVFQVNLSVRQSQQVKSHPFEMYEALRKVNPSPYMAYLQTPEIQVVSASPELLIKKKGKEVSTRPIAGTRSRGINDNEDMKLAQELIHNEKERAEHVMLVDLERNDLGRVCEWGSVEVDEFMVIEKYSHVMHIVSNVKGQLAEGKNLVDIIKATFPGGTITGAPKVRTMEIIEELEPVRRGIYTGSIGWIGFTGDMELNIVIRTMLVKDGFAHVQAGAGIVIDSNPKHEYKESLKKALALWKAKELSEAKVR